MFNMRRDPFERVDENSNTYLDWLLDHAFLMYGMQELVGKEIMNFKKYLPRQKSVSFNLDSVMRKQEDVNSGKSH